jgi:hypothetical protein
LGFIDDLIVFSKTSEEHAQRLEEVLSRLEEANLQLHLGKCVIAQPEVHYLVYVLSEKAVSANLDKVTAVRQYPVPKNVKDVRAFIGLAICLSYYTLPAYCYFSLTLSSFYRLLGHLSYEPIHVTCIFMSKSVSLVKPSPLRLRELQ